MTIRTLAGCVALLSIFPGPGLKDSDRHLYAATPPPAPLALTVRLTTTQALSPASVAALMAETSGIWKEGHIRLRWTHAEPAARDDGDAYLRVVVMARVVPAAGDQSPWAVGELVRMADSRALAIASITGARRVVDEAARWRFDDAPGLRDHRLGIVLGRAVAHEIGHYLLQTNTHASEGLMRASIDAKEFADLSSRAFRLDEAAQAHLATLAARGVLPTDAALGSFSYAAE